MELSEFVRSTLTNILLGVKGANKDMPDTERSPFTMHHGDEISFDVAVTVNESAEGKGGGALKVLGMGVEAGVSGNLSQEQASRVKFTVKKNMTES